LLNLGSTHCSRAHRFRKDLTLTDPPPFADADLFDEAGYLRLYPGIAEAIMQGLVDTARNHYLLHGRDEGRQPNDVDPDFYLAAYPEIERDLGRQAVAADAAPHFFTLGRARGYLPNATAPRPGNGAALGSPFGGFWIDQANALDLIQGRVELERINRRDAGMLRTFALDGIVELNRNFDREKVRDAALIVDHMFTGLFADLLFAPTGSGGETERWRPELTERHMAALDPHMVSRGIRDLLLDKAVTDFLSLIFEARPKLTASQACLREAAPPDRDVAWHAHTLPLQFVAVTFSLDDTDAAPVSVWPGSHRMQDLLWARKYVTLAEARRANAGGLDEEIGRREALVRAVVEGRDPRRLHPTAGTRMIRHAKLIHAVDAPRAALQRRSLTAWYCPSHVAPCYAETGLTRPHVQDGLGFSSGVYPMMDPLD
jgi:hypothetical protein